MKTRGVLLVNLGSPDSASVPDVRKYLGEFLMDGRVLDTPFPIRWGIVHLAILPSRPAQSAEAYEKIWTPEGSPLVVTSRKVQKKLQDRLSLPVGLAMRYQNPSIESAIQKFHRDNIEELLVIPLFPHYAMSSFETAAVRVREVVAKIAPQMSITVVPPYYDHPGYIRALVASAEDSLKGNFDHLLFSFHGIPERHLRKADPTRQHCLSTEQCCQHDSTALATCYRAQCFRTVEAFVEKANIPSCRYSVGFQSRLGRDPWLKPYTDLMIEGLGKAGVRKLLVICPSFVSDCLETLEEIGIRGKETFQHAGGAELKLIPCLNEHPLWIEALKTMVDGWESKTRSEQKPVIDKQEPVASAR